MTAARRLWPTALALLALLTGVVAPLLPAPLASAAVQAGDRVALDVESITPGVLRPDGTLTVRATVRNSGERPLDGLTLRLLLNTRRLETRAAVHAWADNSTRVRAGTRYLAEQAVGPLAPGAQVTADLAAPAATLGLPESPASWGPRGLTVDVVDGDFERQAMARGFVVWEPSAEPREDARTDLSVLVPVTAGAPDVPTAVVPADRMEALTRDGGRLARVLQVAARPDVAWALDPAVLTSAASAAGESTAPGIAAEAPATPGPPDPAPTDGGTATQGGAPHPGASPGGPPPVAAWLESLRGAAPGRDVLALPQADPDVAAVAHSGTERLYDLAVQQGRSTVAELLEVPARSDVAWPVTGSADAATLDLVAEGGATAVVLGAGSQRVAEDDDRTRSGRSTVTAGGRRLDGLLVDTALSAALVDATSGPDAALALTRVLAETAVITREDPSTSPHLLVALPRDWDPDPDVAAAALDAVRSAPWIRRAPLRRLLATEAPDVQRDPVQQQQEDQAGKLPADGLQQAWLAVQEVVGLDSALTRPDEVLDGVEASAVAATAVGWRTDLPAWRGNLDALVAEARSVRRGVHVLEGSAVNLVSAQADLPVTVANDLPQDVEVVVSLRPRSSRLVAERQVPVRLAARTEQRVAVPVKAVANGDTQVAVEVRTPDGELMGDPVTVAVRVRADWETRGIVIAGGLLGLVLVVGLVRTIRGGGRRRNAAVDPLAAPPTQPAATEETR